MAFDDETIEVLIAGYLSRDAAHEDFESVRDVAATCTAPRSSARTSKATCRRSRPTTWCVRAPKEWARSGLSSAWSCRRCCWPRPPSEPRWVPAWGCCCISFTAHELKERAGRHHPHRRGRTDRRVPEIVGGQGQTGREARDQHRHR